MSTRKIDEKILTALEKAGYIRRKDLIEALSTQHSEEKGFSITSLNRRISELINEGRIRVVEPEEFPGFGIYDEDKRAKYLVSSTYAAKKDLSEDLIKKAAEGDSFKRFLTFKEINRNTFNYKLTPVQLSSIANFLGHDERTDTLAIKILHDSILKHRPCISEDDREALSAKLLQVFYKYQQPPVNNNKRLILEIVGFLSAGVSHEGVVWCLRQDLERVAEDKEFLSKGEDEIQASAWIKNVYHSKYLIHFFDKNKTELMDLMWEYAEKKEDEKGHKDERKVALIIDNILDYITENRDKAVYYDPFFCGGNR